MLIYPYSIKTLLEDRFGIGYWKSLTLMKKKKMYWITLKIQKTKMKKMPLIPSRKIKRNQKMKSELSLGKFLFYFKKNWMNNYEIKLSEERTNNICESYHAKLWREVNTFNPLMGIITKYFIEEEFLYRLLVSKVFEKGSSLVAQEVKNE